MMTSRSPVKGPSEGDETEVRARILDAAFEAFMRNGYAAASTLRDRHSRARSKRELYTRVGNKQEMLIACIRARARQLRVPTGYRAARF